MAVGIRITCPRCRAEYHIVSGIEPGETVACLKCGSELVVPDPQDLTPAFAQPTLVQPTVAGSSDDRLVTLALPFGEMPTLQQPTGDASSVEELLSVATPGSGRYVEQGVIAQGGMGEIVLCIDRDIRRPVALKRMLTTTADDPSRRARFVEEAQVTGQLEHPNIVPVHELTRREDGTVYFTMKLVKGKSLADILAEAKLGKDAPPLGELLQVFLKVCDGVAFAHSRGVLHRDLKPANIMVGDFGEVLVMDWGLAKVKGREDIRSEDIVETSRVQRADTRTMEGSMIGTPAYMPPEQAEGKLDQIDERSDIYSLGAILYEILALERAIQGETQMAVILNVVKGNIVPPEKRAPGRNIPRELSAVAMKCLSKLRARRYRSVMDLRKDIGLFLEGRSVSASPDTFGQAVVKLVKRNKGVSTAVGAAAVIIVAITTVAFIRVTGAMQRALRGEQSANAERKVAQDAREQQRATALAASERFAKQAALAAENYRWAEADERLGDAQAVCPDGPWAPYARGRLAQIKGDHEGAVKLFNDALKIAPGQRDIASARDKSVSLLQRVADARKAMKEGGKLANWQVAERIGDTFDEAENWREAAQAYAQALQLLPPNVPREDLEDKLGNAKAWIACEGFHDSIRRLPPGDQAKRIRDKLAELHGNPVSLLMGEEGGRLAAVNNAENTLSYLHPLSGQALRRLDIRYTHVSDLRPLKGMPLTEFLCDGSSGRRLRIKDLSPLRGMQLATLQVNSTQVVDLSPLMGMPLRMLNVGDLQVADLGPLRGMPLAWLGCEGSPVSDLGPLKGMPLKELYCGSTKVSDLGPLKGMPLSILRLNGTYIRDISPLRGMPLTSLWLESCRGVGDLTPLRGAPLKLLDIRNSGVDDLTPLKGTPLDDLLIDGSKVTDLRPLAGLELSHIGFEPRSIRVGMDALRQMKSLKGMGSPSLGACRVIKSNNTNRLRI